jgi:hypothetical protein
MLRNSGQTPATDLTIRNADDLLIEFPKSPLAYPVPEGQSRAVLGPGDEFTVAISRPIPLGSLEGLKKGDISLYAYGSITYSDIFGETHETKYCLVFEPIDGKFVYYSEHNNIT